jgi:hypothetical protein
VDFVVLLAGPAVPGAAVLAEQARLLGAAGGISAGAAAAWSAAYREVLALLTAAPLDAPVPPETLAAVKATLRAAAHALPDADRAVLGVTDAHLEQTLDALLATLQTPWFRRFLVYDPQPALRALRVPALALFGALDLQVPPGQSADPMRAALADSASPRHEVVVFDGLNHLFQTAETGGVQEYARIEETMSPAVLDAVADWIRSLE